MSHGGLIAAISISDANLEFVSGLTTLDTPSDDVIVNCVYECFMSHIICTQAFRIRTRSTSKSTQIRRIQRRSGLAQVCSRVWRHHSRADLSSATAFQLANSVY